MGTAIPQRFPLHLLVLFRYCVAFLNTEVHGEIDGQFVQCSENWQLYIQ